MIAGYLAARLSVSALSSSVSVVAASGLGFAAAFVVSETLIYAAALVLGGSEAFTIQGMAWVLAVDVIAFAGMLLLHVLLKAILERTPTLAAPAA